MAFDKAFHLVMFLEGTGREGERWGMEQETWENLGFSGPVEKASDAQIGQAYRKMWDSCKIVNPEACCSMSVFDVLGEPAAEVAFQCFINLPWKTFHTLLQGALGVAQDGVFGPQTFRAIERQHPEDIATRILDAQEDHYRVHTNPQYFRGLLNRVKKVRAWLAGKVPLESLRPDQYNSYDWVTEDVK